MKKTKNTKELILRVSYELFSTKGYDNTPISLILEKAGISKGGFYHHFKSKEEILDLLAKTQVDAVLEIIHQIADEKDKPALEKFNQLIARVQLFRNENRDQLFRLYAGYLKPENLHLKSKIDTYTLEKALPAYVKIVKQGVEEGVFHTSSSELVAETIIRMAPELRSKMVKLYIAKNKQYEAEIERISDFMEEFVLKILGAEEGTLKIAEPFKSYFLN